MSTPDGPDPDPADAEPGEDDAEPDARAPELTRWRDRRRGMDPENRRHVMDACAIRSTPGWVTHFVLMMVLSVVIAVMGLSADSAALVIGAMLIAPLMTPVLGTAAAITMAMGRPLRRSLVVLALATVGAVLLAWAISVFVRDDPLTSEVIARTSPDGRDLMVAIAAGAAGAYAVSRPDISNSLPGVAIAVALVPPLAVTGMTLEAERFDLARGALLLYGTNLTAIVVAGIVVFVITGFAPPRRLATTSGRVIASGAVAVALLAAVAVPLTLNSFDAADRARERQAIEEAIRDWLVGTGDQVEDIELEGNELSLRVVGLNEPPPTADLERRVRAILADDAVVAVSWTQARLVDATPDGPSDEELLAADVREVIDTWLEAGGVTSYDILRLEVDPGSVRLDMTSAAVPPGVDDLGQRLLTELDIRPELEVSWTPRRLIEPDDGVSVAEMESRLNRIVDDWALGLEGVDVLRTTFDGAEVVVDLVGTEQPDPGGLESMLREALTDAGFDGDDATVLVWFSLRQPVIPPPPTTTAPPPPTTTAPPTTAAPPTTPAPD